MRNLSMKKFGTPTRAAPTVASEKFGLVGAGDPSEWVRTGAWTTGVGIVRFLTSCLTLSS